MKKSRQRREAKNNMHNLNFNTKVQTAKHMVAGILVFLAIIAIFWSTANFDLIVKVVRYPEAVRAMKINIDIVQAK